MPVERRWLPTTETRVSAVFVHFRTSVSRPWLSSVCGTARDTFGLSDLLVSTCATSVNFKYLVITGPDMYEANAVDIASGPSCTSQPFYMQCSGYT